MQPTPKKTIKNIPDFSAIHDVHECIDAMCNFAKVNRNILAAECLQIANDAYELALQCGYRKGAASALIMQSYQQWHLSQTELAMQNLEKSAAIIHELNIYDDWGEIVMVKAMILWGKGEYEKAMAVIYDGIRLLENKNYSDAQGWPYWALGVFNYDLKDYDKSLAYYQKSLQFFKTKGIYEAGVTAYTYIGIGCCYKCKGEIQQAMTNLIEGLRISREANTWMQEARSYYEIGTILSLQGDFEGAETELRKSCDMRKAHGTKPGVVSSLIALTDLEIARRRFPAAMEYITEALALATETNSKPKIYQCHEKIAFLYKEMGNFQKALEHIEYFYKIRSEVVGEEAGNRLKNIETKYATEKSEREAEIERLRNVELKNAHNIIAAKNKEIIDSINYAKRIQTAKLPDRNEIYKSLPDSFVLFKPKDIVSGDFYYFHKNNSSIFIASADCTGHGVPGAFMSMIGSEKLDEALAHTADTSAILAHLNKGIKSSLKQSDSDESTRDGMDIALCSVSIDNCILKYAGANRPLWIIRNGSTAVEEIKATKKAIGGFTEDSQHFETHTIQLQRGDSFYIFSDGYADTFSGGDSKKLTTKKFKEIILSIQNKSMADQEAHLDNFVEDWKAGTEQVDDILVIGVRL